MNNKKYQVFISSTYTDLREERQAAVEAILKAGHIPAGMELFAAGDESQMETIKRWIEASDIFMLILGSRYGSIEPRTGFSYIECEYNYAISIQKPIFSIVVSDKSISQNAKKSGDTVMDKTLPKYKRFRKKVLSKTCSFFDDCKDIKLAIHESIKDIQDRYNLVGWIPATEIQDTKSLVSTINQLSEENAVLKRENKNLENRLNKSSSKLNNTEEFDLLTKVLKSINIELKVKSKNKKFNLFEVLTGIKTRLVIGVTNASNVSELEKRIYEDICPTWQIHGLVVNQNVIGKAYRKFVLTKFGMDYLAYLDKKNLLNGSTEVFKVN